MTRTLRIACCSIVLTSFACGDDASPDDHDATHEESPGGQGGGAADAGAGGSGGSSTIDGGIVDSGGTGGNTGGDASGGEGARDAAMAGEDAGQDDDAGHEQLEPPLRDVTIRFAAKIGERPFMCGETYDEIGSADTTITPRDLKLDVQDLVLVTEGGEEVPVELPQRDPWQAEGVALLDFADESGECVAEGTPLVNDVIVGRVPDLEYTGVAFKNGVPEALNHADVTTLPPALQYGQMQWTWLTGYRFVKLEVIQVVPAGEIFGQGYAHPGSNACSGTAGAGFTCLHANRNAVRLDGFDVDDDVIVLDVAEVFANTNLAEDSQCHGSGAVCAPMYEALGIEYATGNALPSQRAYRVE